MMYMIKQTFVDLSKCVSFDRIRSLQETLRPAALIFHYNRLSSKLPIVGCSNLLD
jgi:hypothetical protein